MTEPNKPIQPKDLPISHQRVTRRTALGALGGASALTLVSVALPGRFHTPLQQTARAQNPEQPLNIWVELGTDSRFRISVPKAEMGQGVTTTFAMIIAEELNAPLSQIDVQFAPSDAAYTDPSKHLKVTGGSTSVSRQYERMRKAGAAARLRIVNGAAAALNRSPDELSFEQGLVRSLTSDETWPPGEFLNAISEQEEIEDPPLKNESEFTLLGRNTNALDARQKINGDPIFGHDVVVPGMRCAAVRHSPVYGGLLNNLEELRESRPDLEIYPVAGGVAVVSSSTWFAEKAVRELSPTFEVDPDTESFNNAELRRRLEESFENEGTVLVKNGDATARLEGLERKLSASYHVPYVPHLCMETMVCTARVHENGVELWLPTQSLWFNQEAVAEVFNFRPEQVVVHATHLGGGFGRKVHSDCAIQAAELSRAVGAPVKLLWSREEDTQHDFYRPPYAARFEGGLSAEGEPIALIGHNSGPSILDSQQGNQVQMEVASLDGFRHSGYTLADMTLTNRKIKTPVPLGFWRSVGVSHNCFFMESFIDEMAALAERDPLEFRRNFLQQGNENRMVRVLEAVADLSRWREGASAPNHALGVAIVKAFGSVVAQVAEVSVSQRGSIRVHKVFCAVDCGKALNPQNVVAQMESGIVFGLSAALRLKVDIDQGRCTQANFDTAFMLPPSQMPEITTTIVNSGEALGGVGEPATPPIAPAVANAVFQLTGIRLRELPLRMPREVFSP